MVFSTFDAAPAQASETITAVAAVKAEGGVSASAPLTVVVERFATDAERAELMTAAKKGGTAAVREWLAKRGDAGTLQLGPRRTAIKFAYARASGAGRLITALTAEPIVFLGAGVPGAKAREGYELGVVILEVGASGPGRGELVPAAKIRIDQNDTVFTDDYSAADVVPLSQVVSK
jgi:hypothetical protein